MKVLGLIPARGGSKGVPRKNIRRLCGKPLLAYTAEAAQQAKSLSRVVLSTEDFEIAQIGKQCGARLDFMRPPHLARDSTPSFEVVRHALLTLQHHGKLFDAVCLLQPTNPLRRHTDIDACVELLETSGADSVVSVLPVPAEYNPHWIYRMNDDDQIQLFSGASEPVSRRQDLPTVFHRDGSIYAVRAETIFKYGNLYGRKIIGYQIDPQFSANIDTENDWLAVERRMQQKNSYAQIQKTEKNYQLTV